MLFTKVDSRLKKKIGLKSGELDSFKFSDSHQLDFLGIGDSVVLVDTVLVSSSSSSSSSAAAVLLLVFLFVGGGFCSYRI